MDQTPTSANTPVTQPASARPSAIDLFGKSVDAIKVNLPLHLLFYFAPMIIGILLFMVLLGSYIGTSALFGDGFDSVGTTAEDGGEALLGVSFILSMVGFIVAVAAVGGISYLANTYVGLQGAQGKKTDAGTAIRATTKYIPSLVGFAILAGLVIMAGFFALIIPGVIITVYLLPRLMILPTVIIHEDLKAMDAYRRADKIVKAGGVWEVVFVTIAISFLGIIPVLGAIASAILGFLYSVAPTFRVLEASPKSAVAPVPTATPAKN